MITLQRTDSASKAFRSLIPLLDAYLKITDGDDHAFYNSYNGTEAIKHVIVAYDEDGKAVGCGALKEKEGTTAEIKRMFVTEDARGQGVAVRIVEELERWAKELGMDRMILETGIHQPAAIRLYEKTGYRQIDNYPPYVGMPLSICFAKDIARTER